MTKSPSAHRTSDITKYRLGKANMKQKNIYKLLDEIAELERQLKIHPMGAIVLKAKIKEKHDKLSQLDPERRIFHNDKQMKESARQGIRGLSVAGLDNLGKEQNIFKAIYEDRKINSKKHRPTAYYVNGKRVQNDQD